MLIALISLVLGYKGEEKGVLHGMKAASLVITLSVPLINVLIIKTFCFSSVHLTLSCGTVCIFPPSKGHLKNNQILNTVVPSSLLTKPSEMNR